MFKRILAAAVVGVAMLAGTGVAKADNSPEVKRLLKKADQYKQDKNFDKAIETLDKVLAVDPGNPDAWSEGAWIFNEQGKYEVAIKAADKALATDPDHSNAHREKGFALMKMGKYRDAAKSLYTAIENNRRNWSAYDYLAEALEKAGRADLAQDVRTLKKMEMDTDR